MRSPLKRLREKRGRHSFDDKNLEYICYLSNKYDIDPYNLLNSFFYAEKKNTKTCGNLKIELRRRDANHTIFLITKEKKVVAQIGIRNELWKNPDKTKTVYSKLVDNIQSFNIYYKTQ